MSLTEKSGTQLSKSESVLPTDDASFRYLAEHLPIQMWMARPDGRLDYVNPTTARYFDRRAEDILGEGWLSVVHPAEASAVVARWTQSIQTGEPYQVEFRLVQGSTGLYRWHLGQALPVRNEAGQIIKWVGSNTDIDEQKRATEVAAASVQRSQINQARLLRVFENAPAVMALYSGPEYVVTMVNAAWTAFIGHRPAVGRPLLDTFPELKESGFLQIQEEVYRSGQPYSAQEMPLLLDRNGDGTLTETYWNLAIQRLPGLNENHHELLVHAVEVTELVHTRRELERLCAEALPSIKLPD